jgi:hypothetical protein
MLAQVSQSVSTPFLIRKYAPAKTATQGRIWKKPGLPE